MIKNIKSIVIVGGGSAGWMSAAILKKSFPQYKITLIESPNFPIIGVGESTLGRIRNFCSWLGLDEKSFMQATDASYKISIRFDDFYEKNGGGYHYPLGQPMLSGTREGIRDWLLKKSLYPETSSEDLVRCFFPSAALFEKNKFSLNTIGYYDNYDPSINSSFHFDAIKFSIFLRDKFCLPAGVEHILDTVTDVVIGNAGVEMLKLESGKEITADLFVDCSGFQRLLISKLEVPFRSYDKILPNNRAWACPMPYVDKEKELLPYTKCTALGYGWTWHTPLWSRLGTGYAYCDQFVSPEDALEEFKNYLCSDKVPVPRSREYIDSLKFRDIEFKTGVYEKIFEKNVVAIGLSAGFLEPLEANGLFTVHEFLFKLIKTLLRGSVTQWDRDVFNTAAAESHRNFSQFIALHYALSVRNDTEYWKYITNLNYDPGMTELKPCTSIGFNDLTHRKMFSETPDPAAGITYVSAGMNYFMLDQVGQKWHEGHDHINYSSILAPVFSMFDDRKRTWNKYAEKEPSLYQYLKKNIFTEDHD
jgi:tryptophan halogenase